MIREVQRFTREPEFNWDAYQDLVLFHVAKFETKIAQFRSLWSRFELPQSSGIGKDELKKFLVKLMAGEQVPLLGPPNGPLGQMIRRLFQTDVHFEDSNSTSTKTERTEESNSFGNSNSSAFPPPTSKEYILRWMAPRPSSQSRPAAQRMYANVREKEIRLCCAFSEDILFFL